MLFVICIFSHSPEFVGKLVDDEEFWLLLFSITVGRVAVSWLLSMLFSAFTNISIGKSAKRKELSIENSIPSKLSFRYEGEINIVSDKRKQTVCH